MTILGISCYYHDAAAALVRDRKIVAAAQEERFTRIKHDQNFPAHAIAWCLEDAGLTARDLDAVAFYDKPFLKFERILETYLAYAPAGIRSAWKALPVWIKQKLWISEHIRSELGFDGELLFPEHHESHAASAFFPSPFGEAAILTMDGVGEWATSSVGHGNGNRITIQKELHFPHSLGLLYSAFTYFTGFRVNSGEYKVMGLAPYGEPKYRDLILDELIDLKEDGSFRMNMRYFGYGSGLKMTNRRFARLFGGPPRKPDALLTQREMDLAASVQSVTEEIMIRMARHAREQTGSRNLCLAGGVALNCVGNGKILREKMFDRIWIQPAAGDAGGAVGAALMAWHHHFDQPRTPSTPDAMNGALLGPSYSTGVIGNFLKNNTNYDIHQPDEEEMLRLTAQLLADGKVVGWFQGRMEFGPRALGSRSILGDPRSEKMQRKLNLKIKYRESFRPFAPSVALEHVSEYFELDEPSPYMLLVAEVAQRLRKPVDETVRGLDKLYQVRSMLPAITHVDGSARIQTVDRAVNPRFHALIRAFEQLTGCPVLINTSFNVRGEPIVCTPDDAWRCFMRTDMDVLVMGRYVIEKKPEDRLADPTETIASLQPD
jgi:carbamoyltransferase